MTLAKILYVIKALIHGFIAFDYFTFDNYASLGGFFWTNYTIFSVSVFLIILYFTQNQIAYWLVFFLNVLLITFGIGVFVISIILLNIGKITFLPSGYNSLNEDQKYWIRSHIGWMTFLLIAHVVYHGLLLWLSIWSYRFKISLEGIERREDKLDAYALERERMASVAIIVPPDVFSEKY
uniref:DUF4405 domain-containing protein n=1 Tax=Panagrellus redivivus TaxID=6233 RepID=A0A7E4WCX8_PANRE